MQNLDDLKKMIKKGNLNISQYEKNILICFSDILAEDYDVSLPGFFQNIFHGFSCRYGCYISCSNGGTSS